MEKKNEAPWAFEASVYPSYSAVIKRGSYERIADAGVTRLCPGLKQFD